MTPEEALLETARFTAVRTGMYLTTDEYDPWIVTGAVLIAQQAAATALNAAGDLIPAQVGATEILLRAASKDRLPAPFTLPFSSSDRRDFDLLVESRNGFLHPRATSWHVTRRTLSRGLPAATRMVRHLILTQPIVPDLVSPDAQIDLRNQLEYIDVAAEFLAE